MRSLPLDIIRDCFDYLPFQDLVSCQEAHESLDALVRDSTQLQLRIHLGQYGIRPEAPGTFVSCPSEWGHELQRLSRIDERLSLLRYGNGSEDGKILQFPVRSVDEVHLTCLADGEIFVPVTHEDGGIEGIAKYRLDDQSKAPEVLGFPEAIRHFQVDAAEGVLLVVFQDEPVNPEGTHHKHSIHLLCKDTSVPIGEPITDLTFSSIQIHQLTPNCHIRGEFLTVTCEAPLSSEGTIHTIKLFHWKTGRLLLSHGVKGARYVVSRIISSSALLFLEVHASSAHLHLFAYHQRLQDITATPPAFSVARYDLPNVPKGFEYLTAHMECSPVSLSGCHKESRVHHLLEDGAGIVFLSLEVQSTGIEPGVEDKVEESELADEGSWDFTTACLMIAPFHRAAINALEGVDQSSPQLHKHDFARWADTSLAWLPRVPSPPGGAAICGYRLLVSEDIVQEGSGEHDNADNPIIRKRIFLYDFTPAHVQNMVSSKKQRQSVASFPLSSSKCLRSWAVLLVNDVPIEGKPDDSDVVERFVVLRSMPSVSPQRLADALDNYVTDARYVVSTKTLRSSTPRLPSAVHFTHEYLLFVQAGVER